MQFEKAPLEGLLILTPKVFGDERGWFYESYHSPRFAEAGIDMRFAQDNRSCSVQNTLRGLHFQTSPGQAKLLSCVKGAIWDVAVDIRPQSPTLGQWHAVELTQENKKQFFIPVGFAHGFVVLSEEAEVHYKCSAVYDATTESGIAWNDPDFAVAWPVATPLLSKRDQENQSFKDFLKTQNP
jgi:dTDP-4-dehydrorhamnose 3,5-epimerase